jgi:thymidine phosphorylase
VPQALLRQKEAEGGCRIRRAQALAQSEGKILVIDMNVLDRVLSWLIKEGDSFVGGIRLLKDIGEEVNKGDPLAEVYTTSYTLAEKAALALQRYAFCIGDDGNEQERRREYIKRSSKGEALERWVNTLLDQFDQPTMNIEEPA